MATTRIIPLHTGKGRTVGKAINHWLCKKSRKDRPRQAHYQLSM